MVMTPLMKFKKSSILITFVFTCFFFFKFWSGNIIYIMFYNMYTN